MLLCLVSIVLLAPTPQEPPFPTIPVQLPKLSDLDGIQHVVPSPEAAATVIFFVTIDCPIANRYVPEMRRIAMEFGKREVAFLLAYVDPYLDREEVVEHRKDFDISIPGVYDDKHLIVKALGATITPQAAIIGSDGVLKYRGRIDDTYVEHGRPREKPTRQDLRIALDEVLSGNPVTVPVTKSIGCDIPVIDR